MEAYESHTDELGTTSDDGGEGDMEIQQLVGNASPLPTVRILPRRSTTYSEYYDRLFQNTDQDGQVFFQEETAGFVSPMPRAHSVNSLLGEALLNSGNPSERDLSRSQYYAEASPASSLYGTTTPSFHESSKQQQSPPPLSQKTEQWSYAENYEVSIANNMLNGKLPPRQPCKERSGFSSVHSRANSETSILSALTMDTSHGQGHHEQEKRRIATIEASLQQPILNDDEQQSLSLQCLPFILKPSSHRRRSSWSFAPAPLKRPLPGAVYLLQGGAWDKRSDSTAFHTVSGSHSIREPQSERESDSIATWKYSV